MPIVIVLLQLGCIVHAVMNRNNSWIPFLLIPGIGPLAYILSHIVPDMFGSYGIRKGARALMKKIDPERDRRVLSKNLDRADTVENKWKLAAESLELKDYARAKALYVECLTGFYEREPELMLGLAKAQFGLEDYVECKKTLDDLIAFNPDFRSSEGHLLFAKCLLATHENEKALEELLIVKDNYGGEEARFLCAEHLLRMGKTERARTVLQELLKRVDVSPAHYQKANVSWVAKAKSLLGSI
jgi:hypothetical protein